MSTEPAENGTPSHTERVDLQVRPPYDASGVMSFLAARAVAGVEVAEPGADGSLRYARTLHLPHGPGAIEVVAVPGRGGVWALAARLELAAQEDRAPAVARVRRLLDLDADPVAVDSALALDPALRPLVEERPGTRVPGAVDPHELVVRAVVGQQISVAAARTHLGRLTARLGTPYRSAFAGLDRLFPTAAQVAAGVPVPADDEVLDPDRPLRLPRRSVRAVVSVARALADGDLVVDVGADAAALRAALVDRPGIGPWTAAYVAMRVLGDPDAWLPGDVALVAGARAVGLPGTEKTTSAAHRALAERASGWAPWRSYAVVHLWRAASV